MTISGRSTFNSFVGISTHAIQLIDECNAGHAISLHLTIHSEGLGLHSRHCEHNDGLGKHKKMIKIW